MIQINIEPIEIHGKKYFPELGTITDTMLGIGDHGIMSSWLYLDYIGARTQGAGGYSLDDHKEVPKGEYARQGFAPSIIFIRRTLEVVGVDQWEHLKGKKVLALLEKKYALIRGLMNVNNPNTYMIFSEIFDESKK